MGDQRGGKPRRGRAKAPVRHLSKTRHVKAGLNLGGPSPKAKYSLATDSEPSSASERWEEPRQGEDSEPETTCLQAVRGLWRSLLRYASQCLMACLLHNDPATCRHQQG